MKVLTMLAAIILFVACGAHQQQSDLVGIDQPYGKGYICVQYIRDGMRGYQSCKSSLRDSKYSHNLMGGLRSCWVFKRASSCRTGAEGEYTWDAVPFSR